MRSREAIALTAMGFGAWGGVAKAANTVTLTLDGAAVNAQFGPGDFDLPRDELMGWIFNRGTRRYCLLRPLSCLDCCKRGKTCHRQGRLVIDI
jgi:hypothetical protein